MEKFKKGLVNETMRIEQIKGILECLDLHELKLNLSTHELKRQKQRSEILIENQQYQQDSLMDGILKDIQTIATKTMETLLYENNKLKLTSAQKRLELAEKIVQIIEKTFPTSELLWILMHLDLERRNSVRYYDTNKIQEQANFCEKRIQIMLQNMTKNPNPEKKKLDDFAAKLRNVLMNRGTGQLRDKYPGNDLENPDLKTVLYDYREFRERLREKTMNFIRGTHHHPLLEKCSEL